MSQFSWHEISPCRLWNRYVILPNLLQESSSNVIACLIIAYHWKFHTASFLFSEVIKVSCHALPWDLLHFHWKNSYHICSDIGLKCLIPFFYPFIYPSSTLLFSWMSFWGVYLQCRIDCILQSISHPTLKLISSHLSWHMNLIKLFIILLSWLSFFLSFCSVYILCCLFFYSAYLSTNPSIYLSFVLSFFLSFYPSYSSLLLIHFRSTIWVQDSSESVPSTKW